MIWRGESEGGYSLKGYLIFGLPLLAMLGFFVGRIMQVQGIQAEFMIPSARDPWHILVTVLAYFRVPVVGLGLLAPVVARRVPRRLAIFFVAASVIPILGLVVIALLDVINATWYGFFALTGFVILAASGLVSLYQRGHRWGTVVLAAATGLYYMVFLVGYHTIMYGDRPRWAEAAAFLQQTDDVQVKGKEPPEMYATVPGVLAFYLGVDPAQTIFVARTGPVDRSVLVYFHPAAQ